MHSPDERQRELLDGVIREIEQARIGFTSRVCDWLRITVRDNNGTQLMVEEQAIDIITTHLYWMDESGPGVTLVEKEVFLGTPIQIVIPKSRLWKYFEHQPDIYSLRP